MIASLETLAVFHKLPATQEKADIDKKMVEGQISAAMYYYLAEKYVASLQINEVTLKSQTLKGL